jgi:hypothetical protein
MICNPLRVAVRCHPCRSGAGKHRAEADIDRTNYQATIAINIAGSTSGPEP